MKKELLLIAASVLAAAVMFSCKKKEDDPTPGQSSEKRFVSGNVSGTWTKGDTYIVTDNLFIGEGKSLTIEEGVTVLMADTSVKPEIIVKGNLYVLGTDANPVKITVPDSLKPSSKFGQAWGGIIAGPTSAEIVLKNAIIELGGATTTESSASVVAGLFKGVAGEGVPVVYFANVNGKLVVQNSIIRNFAEDGLYIDGGQVLVSNNQFYTTGINGGDAINLKSGVLADVAFNLIYSPNTNGLKLSNGGDRIPQAHIIAYNNTIVNAGWRRPTTKGGSVWMEKSVRVDLVNNLLVNDRYGIKRDVKNPEDNRSTFFTTHYYGNAQTGVDQFQKSAEIIGGTNDIIGTKAGDNDPKLVNYPLSTANDNAVFDGSWDFHLQAGAPGLGKGKTDITRHFSAGLTVGGVIYTSPAPATYIGAYGTK